jgi:hypothetical protein
MMTNRIALNLLIVCLSMCAADAMAEVGRTVGQFQVSQAGGAQYSPLATPKCLTYGRVKIPHLAVAGRGMITRFDATWQGAQQIL